MKNYKSSESIYKQVLSKEKEKGLNGYIILIHLGTDDKRTDKFYKNGMRKMISKLKKFPYSQKMRVSKNRVLSKILMSSCNWQKKLTTSIVNKWVIQMMSCLGRMQAIPVLSAAKGLQRISVDVIHVQTVMLSCAAAYR